MMTKTTVIYHSADFDGLFCREIARKFLPDATLIGWDFADAPLDSSLLHSGPIFILDLPVDRPFGLQFKDGWICRGEEQIQPIDRWDSSNITWIDHHKSSIETHPTDIPGYRIDGVAACRLAWQWFSWELQGFDPHRNQLDPALLTKDEYFNRTVSEPLAVRLAGEYDIWDKRDPNAELFQHGLRSRELSAFDWQMLLSEKVNPTLEGTGMEISDSELACNALLNGGRAIQYSRNKENESIIKRLGFDVEFEGLKFLACNHASFNSHLFTAGIKPEHDALLGFKYDGKEYHVSLYHAPEKSITTCL